MDIAQILYSLLLITFLGVLLSFNPMLIIVDIVLVLKTKRPIFNTIMLLAGFATSVAVLFALANLLVDPGSDISLQRIKQTLNLPPVLDILAGIGLLIYGVKQYLKPQQITTKKPLSELKVPDSPKGIYLFAVIKSALSVTNIFAVLVLTRQAVTDNWSIAISTVAIIWLLIIGFLPLLYIMYLHWFKQQSLEKIDARLNKYLQRETGRLLAYLLILIGFIFLVRGLREMSGA